ncbi:MAG: DUF167 domain-containing protein [archaeon]
MERLQLTLLPRFFYVQVKTNRPKTKITAYDESSNTLFLDVHAPPERGKANAELQKYLRKEIGKQVTIKSGLTSKRKLIVVS